MRNQKIPFPHESEGVNIAAVPEGKKKKKKSLCLSVYLFYFSMGEIPNSRGVGTPCCLLLLTHGFGKKGQAISTIFIRGKRIFCPPSNLFFVKPSFKLGCTISRGGHI